MQSSWTHKSHWVFIYLIIYFSNSYIGVPTFQPFWFILGLSNIQIHFGLFLFFATHCQNCKCRCNNVIFKHPFHLKLRMWRSRPRLFACSSLKCQKVTTLSSLFFFLQVDLWHLDFLVSLSSVLSVVTYLAWQAVETSRVLILQFIFCLGPKTNVLNEVNRMSGRAPRTGYDLKKFVVQRI